MFRRRTTPLAMAALLGAAALLSASASAPRAPGLTTGQPNAVDVEPAKGVAQLFRQNPRVLRVADRPPPPIDQSKLLTGVGGWTPELVSPRAPWVKVATSNAPLRLRFSSSDRSSRGPPAA